MGLHHILAFLAVIVLVVEPTSSQDAVPASEVYWNSVLPHIPMPKSVSELLQADVSAVGIGRLVLKAPTFLVYERSGETKQVVSNNNTDANIAVFFLEKDLMMAGGKTMKLHFSSSTTRIDDDDDENTDDAGPAAFLPRYVANSIPFSSDKLPQIYSHFSVKPGSAEAEAIETTVKVCESPPLVGEEKHCATSLESMIDFTTSHMGYNVYPISTQVSGKQATKIQNYTIVGVQKMGSSGEKSVVCHKVNYVYAVYLCHKMQATRAYTVSMEGADGTNIKAVAICHPDTSAWDPNHMSFQVLHVKPGTFPICHFLPQDHLAWVTSN